MNVARKENWPDLLSEFVESRRGIPFSWGENDCCLFAADSVLKITGHDYAHELRGYDSALSALRKIGGKWDAILEIPTKLGVQPLASPKLAKRGDVVAIIQSEHPALGICIGDMIVVPGPECLVFLKMREAVRAWRI
jgi:hypothetical protein